MSKKNKLPKNARRVFKGEIFEVWQWPQKMYDGSTETFEMLKRPDTAVVIPVVGDKILILTQAQPNRPKAFYSIAGGRRGKRGNALKRGQAGAFGRDRLCFARLEIMEFG